MKVQDITWWACGLAVALSAAIGGCATATRLVSGSVGECNAAAGSPYEPGNAGHGRELWQIDPATAIEICTRALSEHPDSIPTKYRLARAHYAAKERSAAKAALRVPAREGYAPAQTLLGRVQLDRGNERQAVQWLKKAIDQSDPEALFLGRYLSSRAVGRTRQGWRPEEFLRIAAERGYYEARYVQRIGDADPAGRLELNREGAALGYPPAQRALCHAYHAGEGVPKDEGQAFLWCSKLAESGDVWAQVVLGTMYKSGTGVERDYARAFDWFLRAAKQGGGTAQFVVAEMYEQGVGVAPDDDAAAKWYQEAYLHGRDRKAEAALKRLYFDKRHPEQPKGLARRQYQKGSDYALGRGVPQDDTLAFAWFHEAAENNLPEAQFNIGLMYANGRGVSRDDEQAFTWFRKAADNGHEKAQLNVALMLATGRGVHQSDYEAVKWFERAARRHNATASYYLGVMSREGRTMRKDLQNARFYFQDAAKWAEPDESEIRRMALAELDRMSVSLSPTRNFETVAGLWALVGVLSIAKALINDEPLPVGQVDDSYLERVHKSDMDALKTLYPPYGIP